MNDEMTPDEPRRARLETSRFRLLPVSPSHSMALMQVAQSPGNIQRWRFFGATVSAPEFERALWDRVLAQFVVIAKPEPVLIGLVQCTSANFRHGTAQLHALFAEDYQSGAWPVASIALFVQYLFVTFPLRKLYAEVPEFNYRSFASGENHHFEVEARLRDHEWHYGRFWDTVILSISRDRGFDPAVDRWLQREA